MGSILAFFYSGIPSYGVAIIGLTVLVRLVLFPLTAKQARSQLKMTQVAPEIKKIQAKYKDDRQKQNEEVMKYYKENKDQPGRRVSSSPGPDADLLRSLRRPPEAV
jgi:Preprotein translocase subunit YidC